MIEGLAVYSIRTHTYCTHVVIMTRPDFTEKNVIVAGGLPLASACLLISVTFNTVLFLLITHYFPPPPSELVNTMFVWLPIFHALTQNKLSNPTKSLHCLPLCELMSITSRKKGGKKRERNKKRGGLEWGRRIRNMSLGFLLLQGEVIWMAVTLNTLFEHVSVMNM